MTTFLEEFNNETYISDFDGSEIAGGDLRNTNVIGDTVLEFSGASEYLNAGNITSLEQPSSLSISMWIKPDNISAFRGLMAMRQAPLFNGWVFAIHSSGTLGWFDGSWKQSNVTLTANIWQHVLISHNGSTITFYINGVSAGSFASSILDGTGADLQIATWDSTSYEFDGEMAEVAVYLDDLSASEVNNIYRNGVDTSHPDIEAYWKLDDGSGTSATDSINSYTASFSSTPDWITDNPLVYTDRGRTTSTQIISNKTLQNFDYTMTGKPGGTNYRAVLSADGSSFINHLGDSLDIGACSFDGMNDNIVVDGSSGDFSSNTFAVGGWCKIDSFESGTITWLANTWTGTVGSSGFGIGTLDSNGNVIEALYASGSSARIPETDFVPTLGEWFHCVFVHGASDDKIYINGVDRVTGYRFSSFAANVDARTTDLYFGSRADNSQFSDTHVSDHIYIDGEPTESEMWDLYANSKLPTTGTLVARWRFDGNANDSSGNGNNGTVSGATLLTDYRDFPAVGYSLIESADTQVSVFDGSNDEIIVADNSSLSFTDGAGNDQPFSISAWVKPYGFSSGANTIISKRQGSSAEWFIGHTGNTIYFWAYKSNVSGAIGATINYTFEANKDYHIVCTYDGSEVYTGFKVYINGVQLTTVSGGFGTGYTGMGNTSAEVNIGSLDSISNYFYEGQISNVAIWDDVRTQAEVTTDYQNGWIDTTDGNIVSYWKLAGDYNDSVGSNNGTNNGTSFIKDIYRPAPAQPTEETLDISTLGTSNLYTRFYGSSLEGLSTPSLASYGIDYVGVANILYNYGGI